MKKLVVSTLFSLLFLTNIFAQETIIFPEPCSYSGPKYGIDSVTAVKSLSLYREHYKQWRSGGYKNEAIHATIVDPWKYCFMNAPKASQNLYVDGPNIYRRLISNAKDEALKERYIDTLFMIYDKNIETFGCAKKYGEPYILGRKGNDLYQYRPNEKNLVFQTLKRSFDLGESETEAAVMSIFYKVLDEMIRDGLADTTLIFEYYDKLSSAIDKNISSYKSELAASPGDSVKINKKIEQYETAEINVNTFFDPWASCEQIIAIYSAKYDDNKTDASWLRKLCALLDKKSCTNDPLYFKAAEALYSIEPSAEAAYNLGVSFYKAKKYSDAAKYLQEAVNGSTDPIEKSKTYLVLSDVYKTMGQYANARNAAFKCTEFDPSNGMAYIVIGDLYMATAHSCGSDPVTQKAGYWAAADKYAKAKSVTDDNTIINIANAKYNAAYGAFPKTEDMFFYNVKKGSTYTISCWYTESTIVRSCD